MCRGIVVTPLLVGNTGETTQYIHHLSNKMEKTMKLSTHIRNLLLLVVAISIGACSSNSLSDESSTQTEDQATVKLRALTSTTSSLTAKRSQLMAELSVDSAKVLVEELSLEHINGRDSSEFNTDAFVLTFDPSQPEQEISVGSIPFGVYDEFELDIDDAEGYHNISDPDFFPEPGSDDGYSIVVYGRYQGQAFMFRTDKDFEVEMDFNPPLAIDEQNGNQVNLTLMVNLGDWFVDERGNTINPLQSGNQRAIEEAIERSFDIINDENDDDWGREDRDDEYEDDWDRDEEEREIHKYFENTGVIARAYGEVEYEIYRNGNRKFEVEAEDLPAAEYEIVVGGEVVGLINVVRYDDDNDTEGEVHYSDPQRNGDRLLDFDPTNQLIEIRREGVVYLQTVLDSSNAGEGRDRDEDNDNDSDDDNDNDSDNDDGDNDEDYDDDDSDDEGDRDDDDYEDDDNDRDDDNDNDSDVEIYRNFINTGLDNNAYGEVEYEVYDNGNRKFELEAEDLDAGTYEIYVGEQMVGNLEVVRYSDGTEGEVYYSDPQRNGDRLLDFDPSGKRVEIRQNGNVYLYADL